VAWVGAVTRRTSGMSRCERIHLLLIDDARRGLEDVAARRTQDADQALAALQRRHGTVESESKPVSPLR